MPFFTLALRVPESFHIDVGFKEKDSYKKYKTTSSLFYVSKLIFHIWNGFLLMSRLQNIGSKYPYFTKRKSKAEIKSLPKSDIRSRDRI